MPIETLTSGILQKRLQIANSCAAIKGGEVISKKNKGISCIKDQKKVQLILDLVDSLKDYIDIDETNINDPFDDTDTCLDTNEIIGILDRLCQLCSDPCTTYVNFETE